MDKNDFHSIFQPRLEEISKLMEEQLNSASITGHRVQVKYPSLVMIVEVKSLKPISQAESSSCWWFLRFSISSQLSENKVERNISEI